MKLVIASLSLCLAACSAPQAPAEPAPPAPAPAAAPAAPTTQELPMAKRAAGQEGADPMQIFRAFGTEPFWNVNVEGSNLTYTTPDDPAGMSMQSTRREIDGGVELSGNHDGTPFVLRVVAGDCNDGMSDNRYTLVATFRHGDRDLKGCGEAAK